MVHEFIGFSLERSKLPTSIKPAPVTAGVHNISASYTIVKVGRLAKYISVPLPISTTTFLLQNVNSYIFDKSETYPYKYLLYGILKNNFAEHILNMLICLMGSTHILLILLDYVCIQLPEKL